MDMFRTIYNLSRNVRGGAFLLRVLYSCDIPRKVKIGKNVSFGHRALGVVTNSGSVIEDGVSIQHHVLLAGGSDGCPIIRKNVRIGAYAIIMGNVEIGENAVIGAGTMVLHDIEPNSTYINPRELKRIK